MSAAMGLLGIGRAFAPGLRESTVRVRRETEGELNRETGEQPVHLDHDL